MQGDQSLPESDDAARLLRQLEQSDDWVLRTVLKRNLNNRASRMTAEIFDPLIEALEDAGQIEHRKQGKGTWYRMRPLVPTDAPPTEYVHAPVYEYRQAPRTADEELKPISDSITRLEDVAMRLAETAHVIGHTEQGVIQANATAYVQVELAIVDATDRRTKRLMDLTELPSVRREQVTAVHIDQSTNMVGMAQGGPLAGMNIDEMMRSIPAGAAQMDIVEG